VNPIDVHDVAFDEATGFGAVTETKPEAAALDDLPRPPKRNFALRTLSAVAPGVITFAIIFGVWQIIVQVRHISAVEMVSPSAMVTEVWHHPGLFWSNNWVTLQEAFWGFLIAVGVAGLGAAIVVHSRVMDRSISPVVAMLQAIPILAVGPVLVIWLGHVEATKIIIAALITFSPLYASAVLGFSSVGSDALELMRSVNAGKTEIFVRLRIPNSLPYLVSATKICVPLAIVGAVVGEFVGSYHGLGYLMVQAQNYLNAPLVWGCLLVLVIDAVVLRGIVSFLGYRLLRWNR
jgi:NitT/TauT family transport system permease protein